uniref:Pseudouridine synthase I TruA alpha/beta domain-containing protein n=1 Tax=Ditylenchus dipsaci TaxID=166011 RepID=A0A915EJL0_9BILA
MQEIDTNPNWSVAKKKAVKVLVGSRQKNERTFIRCRAKGRTIKSQSKQGPSNCSILDGDFSFEQFNHGYFDRQHQQLLNESVLQESQKGAEQLSANQMLQQWAEETASSMDISIDMQSACPVVDTSSNHTTHDLHSNHEPTNNNNTAEYRWTKNLKSSELREQKRENKNKSKKSIRQIDFSLYPQRRIALLFLYTGWNYKGLVFQDVTENTVEEHIMRVMETAMLVNTREAAQWTRCGRTDQGVSAFRQVAAVTVRSTDTSADGVFWSMDSDPATRVHSSIEIPYVKLLNGNLPKSIRILAWCPTHRDFNARTHTDLALMNDGCSRLVGSHDFRNFCQIDKNRDRVQMCYLRRILEAKVEEVIDHPHPNRTLTVKASGFLWHQIRCIVTLLYQIGSGRESPELISQLLDIQNTPARPQYQFANTLPLCLFDCSYPDGDLQWIYDTNVLREVITDLQKTWAEHQVKANILRSMINQSIVQGLEDFTIDHPTPKTYIPIMKRPMCMSLEQRKKDMQKKQQNA